MIEETEPTLEELQATYPYLKIAHLFERFVSLESRKDPGASDHRSRYLVSFSIFLDRHCGSIFREKPQFRIDGNGVSYNEILDILEGLYEDSDTLKNLDWTISDL